MDDLIHRIAEDMLPLPVEKFFTMARAPDMWFGDELPPTLQDYLADPAVQQARWIARHQILTGAAKYAQRQADEQARRDKLARQGRAKRRRR
jgi:hypothetical protein